MKTNIIYSMLLLVAALCSCNSDECFAPETSQPDSGAIELTVNAHNFVTDGAPDTRATDNGKETTFENDDRVGVIILDGSSNIVYNNIPYKYNGSQWVFDSGNNESKSQCYYDNKAGSLTYIVYYPYSSVADGAKSESDLKAQFPPKVIQQSKEAYRASDLMVWTSLSATPLKTLTAELKHVYASVSLSPKLKYTLGDGNEITYITSRLSDVNLTISDKVYSPYRAEDGSFRCILPVGFSDGNIRCFYTVDGKTYGGTFNIASVAANTRYTSTQQIDAGIYGLDKAKVGDFYCKNNSDEGYLIPGEVASLDDGINCLGIVYWVGSKAIDHDVLLKENHSECTHGLVVGLHEFRGKEDKGMHWSDSWESIRDNWINQDGNPYKGKVDTYKQNKLCGYSNTVAMTDYNKGSDYLAFPSNVKDNQGLLVLPCVAINEYAKNHTVPTASSGWYFPSIYELKYMCWGQENTGGVVGRDLLNRQIGKVSSKLDASPFSSSSYWSSTEGTYSGYGSDGRVAWDVYFGSGDTDNDYRKSNSSYLVRPSLAF